MNRNRLGTLSSAFGDCSEITVLPFTWRNIEEVANERYRNPKSIRAHFIGPSKCSRRDRGEGSRFTSPQIRMEGRQPTDLLNECIIAKALVEARIGTEMSASRQQTPRDKRPLPCL
jgi:hypothetical protein